MAKGIRAAPPIPPGMAITLPAAPRGPQVPPPEPGTYDYEVISSLEPETGGARYPFLDRLGRHWTVVTQALEKLDEPVHPHHTFGLTEPTLQFVREDGVVKVYVDGMSEGDFCAATGLRLHPQVKGQYVMGKRLSRVLRPHFVSGSFAPGEVRIAYLDDEDYARFSGVDPALGPKVWDGGGVVSRRLLARLAIPGDLPPARAARLRRELAHGERVEFTVMTARGQDKGHAMVADQIVVGGQEVDFLLPRDTKRELTLEGEQTWVGGQTWVGFDFVHGQDHMRIDIQSAINLHPFFTHEQYARWLHDAGAVFVRAVESGDVVAAMARIDRHETLDEVERYGTRLFFASGGHPLHFRHHTRSLMRQRLEQLNHGALHRHRIEVPGGRYYVMPCAIGRAAGYEGVDVPPGQVRIDQRRGTAWVNDRDWLSLPGSPAGEGIAGILGGADHDDALWLHAFDDHDDERKVLCWRSPNQLGEYVVLRPTANSDLPTWETAEGEVLTSVPGDSRKLPARIDHRAVTYTRRVDHEHAGVYTLQDAIARARANAGALGMTCNTLMVAKAVYGDLPEGMPAPLEDIIDAQVKTGADTGHIVGWNYDYTRRLLEARTPVPRLLIGDREQGVKGRLSIDYRDREHLPPRPVPTTNHWLDRTVAAVREHIATIEAETGRLAARAMPPRRVFDSVFDDPEAIEWGAHLNALYTHTLRTGGLDYERAREACEAFLDRFAEEDQNRALRGAIYSSYLSAGDEGRSRSDAAVWQKGWVDPETGRRARGIEHRTIRALREIGVLDEVGQTSEGLIAYPGAVVDEPPVRTLGIRDVWLNLHKAEANARGKPLPEGTRREQMRRVPRVRREAAKRRVEQLTRAGFRGAVLRVEQDEAGQLVAYTERGNVFGLLEHAGDLQPGDRVTIHHARAHDGNLRATYTKLPPQETEESTFPTNTIKGDSSPPGFLRE